MVNTHDLPPDDDEALGPFESAPKPVSVVSSAVDCFFVYMCVFTYINTIMTIS